MKDYKEILEGVMNIINTTEKSDIGFANICVYIYENCPELKESEDERIRKKLIEAVKGDMVVGGTKDKQLAIAWLEKQGEHKAVEDSITLEEFKNAFITKTKQYDIDLPNRSWDINALCKELYSLKHQSWQGEHRQNTNYPKFDLDDVLALQCCMETVKKVQEDNYLYKQLEGLHGKIYDAYYFEKYGEKAQGESALEAIKEEKVDNANKVTKFKVGDWVVTDKCDTVQIGAVNNGYYTLYNGMIFNMSYVDKCWHLWNITDAKDGDVLVASDASIFLFKGTIDCACIHYVALATNGAVKFNEGLEHCWETSRAVHPATKEQRDLLFQKMSDAGYTFDFDKKELKKIEQKPAENEELTEFDKAVGVSIGTWNPKSPEQIQSVKAVSKKLLKLAKKQINDEQKPAEWSEEDEKFLSDIIKDLVHPWNEYIPDRIEDEIKWLKNRLKFLSPQSQNIMSEDEFAHIVGYLVQDIVANEHMPEGEKQPTRVFVEKYYNKLRPQSTWKPSDEQIEALEHFVRNITESGFASPYDSNTKLVYSLLNDLKKLKL